MDYPLEVQLFAPENIYRTKRKVYRLPTIIFQGLRLCEISGACILFMVFDVQALNGTVIFKLHGIHCYGLSVFSQNPIYS